MKRLKDLKGLAMEWVQPKALRRYHELRVKEEVYATLAWQKPYGSLATAESSDGTFTLKRGGFLHPHVTIREAGSMDDLAVMYMGFLRNGVLEFREGRRYLLRKLSFWRQDWGVFDEYERPVCSIKKRAAMKHRGEVRIERDTRKDRYLIILLAAGWYSIVLAAEEAATAAAVAGSA